MFIKKEILDNGEALKRHTFGELRNRFERNVDSPEMPSWKLVWEGYHLMRNLENLKYKYQARNIKPLRLAYYVSNKNIIFNRLEEN